MRGRRIAPTRHIITDNFTFRAQVRFRYGMFRFYRKHYAARRVRPVDALVYCESALKLIISILRSAARRRTNA
jgi:hypothetical protein